MASPTSSRTQKFLNNGACCMQGEFDRSWPRSWPSKTKWTMISALGTMTFITSLAPSMFAPSIPQTMREFNSQNDLLATLVVSIYVLGWASGPLIVAPLSEFCGRLWVYHVSNSLFVVFTIGCALSNTLNMLLAFRFLAGATGSAVLSIGGGTVADLFNQEERGTAMTVWTMGALLGPIVGPVCGGVLAESWGWRSTFWVMSIAGTISTAFFCLTMRETYVPVLTARLNVPMHDVYELETSNEDEPTATRKFAEATLRPLHMLLFSPIVLIFSLYVALVYGYLYLLITTIPTVFGPIYRFSTAEIGYAYLGLGVGMMASLLVFGLVSDRLLQYLAARSGGGLKPEHRLPPLIPGAFLVPTGIVMYGWSAQYELHWMVPVIGTALLGAGLNASLMSIQTYLVDVYPRYAASVMAANTVLRSLAGAFLPLAGPPMFRILGLGWGSSLLGFIGFAFLPLPIIMFIYGENLRKHSKF